MNRKKITTLIYLAFIVTNQCTNALSYAKSITQINNYSSNQMILKKAPAAAVPLSNVETVLVNTKSYAKVENVKYEEQNSLPLSFFSFVNNNGVQTNNPKLNDSITLNRYFTVNNIMNILPILSLNRNTVITNLIEMQNNAAINSVTLLNTYFNSSISQVKENENISTRSSSNHRSRSHSNVTYQLNSSDVTVINNAGVSSDSIVVNGLTSGDVVRIYNTANGGMELVSKATNGSSLEINANDLLKNGYYYGYGRNPLMQTGGTIYVSVDSIDKNESGKIAVNYGAEPVSHMLNSSDVTVINNVGVSSDSIVVNGLTSGDVVRIYNTANGGMELVSKATNGSSLEINANDLLKNGYYYGYGRNPLMQTGGTIYVSVDGIDKNESGKIAVNYGAEPVSHMLNSSDVTVINNAGVSSDSIIVNGLTSGDVVRIYSRYGQELVSKATNASSLEITADYLSNSYGGNPLMQTGGTIYVSLDRIDKDESEKIAMYYEAEPISNMLATQEPTVESTELVANVLTSSGIMMINTESISNELTSSEITIINEDGIDNDSIIVNDLTSGDVVRIYLEEESEKAIIKRTTNSRSLEITADDLLNISGGNPLMKSGGTIYVSVENVGKTESGRIAVDYEAEQVSNVLTSSEVVAPTGEMASNVLTSLEVVAPTGEMASNVLTSLEVVAPTGEMASNVLTSSEVVAPTGEMASNVLTSSEVVAPTGEETSRLLTSSEVVVTEG